MTVDPDLADQHVAERLRTARVVAGLSQAEMAAGLRVSPQLVAKMETGASRISAGRLHAIAEFLQLPHGFFFQGLGGQQDVPAERQAFASTQTGRDFISRWPNVPLSTKRTIIRMVRDATKDKADD